MSKTPIREKFASIIDSRKNTAHNSNENVLLWEPIDDEEILQTVSRFNPETKCTEMRMISAGKWYAQFPFGTRIRCLGEGKMHKCSKCEFKGFKARTMFHCKFAHFGGCKCEDCGKLFFNHQMYVDHKKKRNCIIEPSLYTKNSIAALGNNRVESHAFLMPMIRGHEKNYWSGTSSCNDAKDGAWEAIKRCETAATKNGSKAQGCTSLIQMIIDGWEPLPNEAFFVYFGGTFNAADALKFLCRRLFDLPGNNKPFNCIKYFENYIEDIVEYVYNEPLISTEKKELFKRNVQFYYKNHKFRNY